MKKAAVALLVLIVGALGVMVYRQQEAIAELEGKLAEKTLEKPDAPRAAAPAPAAKPARAPAPRDDLEAAMQEMAASASPTLFTAQASGPKKGPDLADFLKSIGSVFTNQAMKDTMRGAAEIQLDLQYGRLFKFLNLPPESLAALKKLLMDRQMAMAEAGMAMLGGGFSKESLEASGQSAKARKEEFDKQIAALLGTEDYDAFRQYEETQPERSQVEMLNRALASSGEPLSAQQEYDLVNALYAARTNSPARSAAPAPGAAPDPALFTAAGLESRMAEMDRQQEQNAAIAAKILSPAQNEQYQKVAEQQRTMNQLGMKMASQLFGGLSNAAPPNAGPK